jgi:hypothetical protein
MRGATAGAVTVTGGAGVGGSGRMIGAGSQVPGW